VGALSLEASLGEGGETRRGKKPQKGLDYLGTL